MACCGLAWVGRGEDSQPNINPALLYNQAFLVAPDLSRADSDYLFNNNWQGQQLPDRLGSLLAQYDSQFRLVRRAALSQAECDWGIDLSAGPNSLLPHLARAKGVCVTARLRVPWHLQNGRQEDARDEMLAAFALARNVSRDGTLIATLVQIANEAIQCSSLAANFGQFTPQALQQLQDGIEALPVRRTVAECLPNEKTTFLNWIRRKVIEAQQEHPGEDGKVMEKIRGLLSFESQTEGSTNLWLRVAEAAGGTSEGVLRLLSEREQAYDRAVAFVKLPYPEFRAQSQAFKANLETSGNPFITESLPSFVRARERELRILTTLEIIHAGLDYKLHGEAAFNRINDPCGTGPFAFRRFMFEGVDRGFELRSAFDLGGNMAVLVFVEKAGAPFQVDGNYPGRALPKVTAKE